MKCDDVKKMIDHREIIQDKAALAHLKACADCASEYAYMNKMTKAFTAVKTNPDSRFNAMVWAKIGQKAPKKRYFTAGLLWPAAGLAAAALVFMMVLTVKTPQSILKPAEVLAEIKKSPAENKTVIAGKDKTAAPAPEKKAPQTAVRLAAEKNLPVENMPAPEKAAEKTAAQFASQAPGLAPSVKVAPAQEPAGVAAAGIKPEGTQKPQINSAPTAEPLAIKKNVIEISKNDVMEIKYRIDETSFVRIEAYDRLGQSVKKFAAENKTPGVYEIKWKGDDNKGAVLAGGVYLIYVETHLVKEKIKAVIVK